MQISRVTRPKSAARQAYDRLSHFYDLLAGSSEAPNTRAGLHMLGVHTGDTVLEIGCGTGRALAELAGGTGETGYSCGLDLSPGMLCQARSTLAKTDMAKRAHLLCGDGAFLPFASQSFHVIFMSFTLELFDTPEIPLVLAECWRALKLGGQLGAVCLSKPMHPSWIVRLYEWFHAQFPSYVDCRPIDAKAMIQAAGFSCEKQQIRTMWGLPVEMVLARKVPYR